MITTKGKYKSEIEIIRKLPDWKSNGKIYKRVVIEFVLTGYVTECLVENLIPQDEVRKVLEDLRCF